MRRLPIIFTILPRGLYQPPTIDSPSSAVSKTTHSKRANRQTEPSDLSDHRDATGVLHRRLSEVSASQQENARGRRFAGRLRLHPQGPARAGQSTGRSRNSWQHSHLFFSMFDNIRLTLPAVSPLRAGAQHQDCTRLPRCMPRSQTLHQGCLPIPLSLS